MKTIDCKTSNCEHNLKCRCCAGVIAVDEKGKCASRIRRDGGALAQSFADIEAGEEFDANKLGECTIQCQATCAYQRDNACHAPAVDFKDALISTKCKTKTT